MKKTYLFDFDGTLVDSMPTFGAVMIRILDERGIAYSEDILKIITPLGYRGTAEYFRTLGVKESVDELIEIMNTQARYEYENNIPAKTGVEDTLKEMKALGYSLNVLTASPHIALDPCLKRLGLWELFDKVWSCDDFGTTKSDPEIYKMAADRMGVAVGDVVFVDDNINAVKTAKQVGMISIGIFDESSAEYVDEFKKTADGYAMQFEELLKIWEK
jgi:HAD superfamily hydrolase (TIGR01509 family)